MNYDNNRKNPQGSFLRQRACGTDVRALDTIRAAGVETVGRVDYAVRLARHLTENLELLDLFIEELLPRFGDFQDALTEDSWTVYHSRLSFAMNAKTSARARSLRRWNACGLLSTRASNKSRASSPTSGGANMAWHYWAKMPECA